MALKCKKLARKREIAGTGCAAQNDCRAGRSHDKRSPGFGKIIEFLITCQVSEKCIEILDLGLDPQKELVQMFVCIPANFGR